MLENLTKKFYNTTSHRLDYDTPRALPCEPETRKETKAAEPEKVKVPTPYPIPGREQMYNDVMCHPNAKNPRCVLCNCQISVTDFLDGTASHPVCNYCKSTGVFRLDFYHDPYRYKDQVEQANHVTAPLSLCELRRLTGSKVACKDAQTHMPDPESEPPLMKLTKAPIERTRLYASPLNYLGYYSGRQRNR